ncbi:hypothetical protein [uncultured Alistipes sp.]|uniref:hypothetical protein n=1 Tax=uncultured Alistipes sp. TaxID=538949 RepID=UPI00266FEEE3|nr:hypothetical protein [uncultured Alistipes sp.]
MKNYKISFSRELDFDEHSYLSFLLRKIATDRWELSQRSGKTGVRLEADAAQFGFVLGGLSTLLDEKDEMTIECF